MNPGACSLCPDVPLAHEGRWAFNEPGQPVELFSGQIRRLDGQRVAVATGRVVMRWRGTLRIDWELETSSFEPRDIGVWSPFGTDGGNGIRLNFDGLAESELETLGTSIGSGTLRDGRLGDEDAELAYVRAHWISLPPIFPAEPIHAHASGGTSIIAQRIRLSVRGWQVTIDARPDLDTAFRSAAEDHSFVVSHVVDLRRIGGEPFTGGQAQEVLTALQYVFSFALGYWTGPAIPVGFDGEQRVRWSTWRPLHSGRPRSGSGWWAPSWGEDLPGLVEAYLDHWLDSSRRQSLAFATTAAILAVESGFVEQRMQTAFSAIEMLSWVTEVLEGDTDEGRWHSKGAAWRLRRLLVAGNIDVRIAPHLDAIAQFAALDPKIVDAPHAVSEVRHQLTHPRSPSPLYAVPGLVAEAARLTASYLNLILLHRIGYVGRVADTAKPGGWVGVGAVVPWASRAVDD